MFVRKDSDSTGRPYASQRAALCVDSRRWASASNQTVRGNSTLVTSCVPDECNRSRSIEAEIVTDHSC